MHSPLKTSCRGSSGCGGSTDGGTWRSVAPLLLVNDDAAAADQRAFGQRAFGARVDLVVVVDDIGLQRGVVVPDPDPEPIRSAAADVAIDGGELEPEAARAVDGPGALVLGAR